MNPFFQHRYRSNQRAITKPARRTVLVIDDEPRFRELYSEILLRELKARVLCAADSSVAFRLVLQSSPDLIISDIHRPGLDGLRFVRALRRMSCEIPILIVSGALSHSFATAARSVGVNASLGKPFDVRAFTQVVRRLLHPFSPQTSVDVSGSHKPARLGYGPSMKVAQTAADAGPQSTQPAPPAACRERCELS